MKSNWEKVKLSTALKQIKNTFDIQKGVIYKQITVSKNGNIILREEKSGDLIGTKKQTKVKAGWFIYSRLGLPDGAFGLIPQNLDGAIVTGDMPVFEIDYNLILSDYLNYMLRNSVVLDFFKSKFKGSAQSRVREPLFLSLEIPLPPLPEQKRIVKKIKEIEERAKKIKIIKGREFNYSETLLEEIFLNLILDGWPRVKLGNPEIARTGSGGTPDKGNPKYYKNGKIIWLKSGELQNNINILDSEEKITEEAIDNSSAKLFPSGSVLIAMYGATVGKVGILSIPASINQAVAAIIPIENKLYNKYLFYFLKSLRKDLLKSGFGGAQPNISQTVVKNILVPVPSLDKQKNLVKHFEDIKEKISKLDNEIKKSFDYANALMPSVLSKAFNGEL